jgi:hypothetical protein
MPRPIPETLENVARTIAANMAEHDWADLQADREAWLASVEALWPNLIASEVVSALLALAP